MSISTLLIFKTVLFCFIVSCMVSCCTHIISYQSWTFLTFFIHDIFISHLHICLKSIVSASNSRPQQGYNVHLAQFLQTDDDLDQVMKQEWFMELEMLSGWIKKRLSNRQANESLLKSSIHGRASLSNRWAKVKELRNQLWKSKPYRRQIDRKKSETLSDCSGFIVMFLEVWF